MTVKRKNMAHIICSIFIICIVVSTVQAYAINASVIGNTMDMPSFGVSVKCPTENTVKPMDANKPSGVWNIQTKGQYSFRGDSTSNLLYTDKKFYGKTNYTFYVKNTGSKSLEVTAERTGKTYASTKISAGKTAKVTFSDIKSTTEFYMTFKGSSFEGNIK